MQRRTLILIMALLTIPFTSLLANDGTPPWIFELAQEGQDVKVTLAIVDNGEPGLDDCLYKLERSSDAESDVVFKDRDYKKETPVESIVRCVYDDAGWCDDHPDECEDCDGDGVKECYDWCETVNKYVVTDQCVSPGETVYSLLADWLDRGYEEQDSDTITVTDSGEDCDPGDDDDDDDDDDDSCGS